MYIEIAWMIGILALIFCYVAEWKNRKTEGIIGGLLILLLGLWVMTDGIQMKTGETISALENSTDLRTYNGTMLGAGTGNDTAISSLDGATNITTTLQNSTLAQNTNYNETGNGAINTIRTETLNYTYSEVTAPVLPFLTNSSRLLWGLGILLIGIYIEFRYIIGSI